LDISKKLEFQLKDTFDVLEYCFENKKAQSFLTIAYSLIDTLSWIAHDNKFNTNKEFKIWVKQYLLPGFDAHQDYQNTNKIIEEDLYSARCGVLHCSIAESSNIAKGIAEQIWYTYAGIGAGEGCNMYLKLETGMDVKSIRVDDLYSFLLAAYDNFKHCLKLNYSKEQEVKISKILVFEEPSIESIAKYLP
jgi:hypothetical protein